MTKSSTNLALLYVRVSTSMQVNDGISLDAQERSLKAASDMYGFDDYRILREEGRSGKSISGRPMLKGALTSLESKEANALIVTRLDRLARSTSDFLSIVDHSQKHDWRLIMLDLNLDTSSHSSRFVVTIMAAMAEMERGMISERQKDVHRDRRSSGKKWGIDLGPLPDIEQNIRERIYKERNLGLSYQLIADGLNAESVPTAHGGEKWYAATVRNSYLAYKKTM